VPCCWEVDRIPKLIKILIIIIKTRNKIKNLLAVQIKYQNVSHFYHFAYKLVHFDKKDEIY